MKMIIIVELPEGVGHALEVDSSDSISFVKGKLQDSEETAINECSWYFDDQRILSDSDILAKYAIKNHDILHLKRKNIAGHANLGNDDKLRLESNNIAEHVNPGIPFHQMHMEAANLNNEGLNHQGAEGCRHLGSCNIL